MDSLNALISKKLDDAYIKQKNIASSLSMLGVSAKNKSYENVKSALESGPEKSPEAAKEEESMFASSLESHMAEMIKNAGRYNALTRTLSIRNRIYETAVKGR